MKQYQRKVGSLFQAIPESYSLNMWIPQIEGILDREKQIAREALAQGNKSRALTALRRRKYQESLLAKTDSQLETLQNLV